MTISASSNPRRRLAELELEMVDDVADLVRLLAQFRRFQVLVQDRRVVLHGVQHVDGGRQHLVVHLDQLQGLFRNVDVDGGHRGHGMPAVQHLVVRQRVVAQMLHVDRHLAEVGHAVLGLGHVVRRHHRLDARQGLGLAGIDRADAGVGVRAAQHLAVQHAGQPHVGAVNRPPGHFVGAVRPHRTGSDDLIRCRCFCHSGNTSMWLVLP